MTNHNGATLTMLAVAALAGLAQGEDFFPPDFRFRGDLETTTQEWDFLMDWEYKEHGPPDGTSGITNTPFGTPDLYAWPGFGGQYVPGVGPGPGGAVSVDGMDVSLRPFTIPIPTVGTLTARIQVTYKDSQGQGPPLVQFFLDDPPWGTRLWETILPVPGHADWFVYATDIAEPCIRFNWMGSVVVDMWWPGPGGVLVSEVVIDTLPEPATLGLLALGALAAIRRKR